MTDTEIRYHQRAIDGQTVFYREAGDPRHPTVVLLHGFPSSSHMFRNLIPALAEDYHVIATDHIGFGASSMPTVDEFSYSFDHLADITWQLLNELDLGRFAIYIQDYGAPIGLRIAAAHPERISGLIVQNGNAYTEGFTPFWDLLFAHAKDRQGNEAAVRALLEIDGTRFQYVDGVPAERLDRVSPDNWVIDQAGLNRPGNKEIQLQLLWDYQFNVPLYPTFQAYFRAHQPPTLITWGK
ncbi:MAG: alpha/beta fold hydrolase, partial [Mycobacterium sp.]